MEIYSSKAMASSAKQAMDVSSSSLAKQAPDGRSSSTVRLTDSMHERIDFINKQVACLEEKLSLVLSGATPDRDDLISEEPCTELQERLVHLNQRLLRVSCNLDALIHRIDL